MQNEKDICSICQEDIIKNEVKLKCSHIFCDECITKWFLECKNKEKIKTCPICRKECNEHIKLKFVNIESNEIDFTLNLEDFNWLSKKINKSTILNCIKKNIYIFEKEEIPLLYLNNKIYYSSDMFYFSKIKDKNLYNFFVDRIYSYSNNILNLNVNSQFISEVKLIYNDKNHIIFFIVKQTFLGYKFIILEDKINKIFINEDLENLISTKFEKIINDKKNFFDSEINFKKNELNIYL